MRPVFRVALSLALLMFASCDSPAQNQSPTSIAPAAKDNPPADDPSSLEAGFAGETGLTSEGGLAGGVIAAEGAADVTPEGQIDALIMTPPANTTAEEAGVPHAAARAEIPPVAGDPRDEKIFELTERVAALQTEIEELKLRLRQLENLEQRVADLKLSVDDLTTAGEGPDAGRRALGAMSESPQLRGEIAEKLQGKVRLVNNTGREQVVYINGTPWTVVTGKSFVYAPVGKVSFQFLGEAKPFFKGVHEWEANPTSDEMELVVNLSATTDASSSEESVVTRRAVSLDDTGSEK